MSNRLVGHRGNIVGIVFLLGLASYGWAQAPPCRVTAEITPKTPTVGEPIVYIVRVECSQAEEKPQVEPPAIADEALSDLQQQGTQQQTLISNGRMTVSYEFRYSFTASRAGPYTLAPATVAVDGQIYETNKVTFRVVPPQEVTSAEALPDELRGLVAPPRVPNAPQLERALTGKLFILPVVETTTPLTGQQFIVSYHLVIDTDGLRRAGIDPRRFRGGGSYDLPRFQEFLKEELFGLPQQPRFEEQTFGTHTYSVAPLYQVALTPTKAGVQTIEPMRLTLVFPLAGRSRSPFDDLFMFDPFDAQGVAIVVQSVPLQIQVRPLPSEAKPPDFSGAVGHFEVSASVDKEHLTANEDVARLRLVIQGQGNAAVATPPRFPEVDGLQLLEEPKSSTDRRIENNKLVTSKTIDYLFRATRPGQLTIPPLRLVVYDPQVRRYVPLASRPISLTVAPGTAAPVLALQATTSPAASVSQPVEAEARRDLRYIHEAPLRFTDPSTKRRERVVQALLCSLATLSVILVAELRRRRSVQFELTGVRYRSKVYQETRATLQRLARARSTPADEFCEQLARAVRRYLAALVDEDAQGATWEELADRLSRRGVSEETLGPLRQILETCDSIRYAPTAAHREELLALVERAQAVVEEVRRCVR